MFLPCKEKGEDILKVEYIFHCITAKQNELLFYINKIEVFLFCNNIQANTDAVILKSYYEMQTSIIVLNYLSKWLTGTAIFQIFLMFLFLIRSLDIKKFCCCCFLYFNFDGLLPCSVDHINSKNSICILGQMTGHTSLDWTSKHWKVSSSFQLLVNFCKVT